MTIVTGSASIVRRYCARFALMRQQLKGPDGSRDAEQTIALAIEAVRTLAIPHFDTIDDEVVDGEVIH